MSELRDTLEAAHLALAKPAGKLSMMLAKKSMKKTDLPLYIERLTEIKDGLNVALENVVTGIAILEELTDG